MIPEETHNENYRLLWQDTAAHGAGIEVQDLLLAGQGITFQLLIPYRH